MTEVSQGALIFTALHRQWTRETLLLLSRSTQQQVNMERVLIRIHTHSSSLFV